MNIQVEGSLVDHLTGKIKRLDTYSDEEIVDFVLESRYKNRFDPLVLELAKRLKSVENK
jgi:hypothetical protein